MKNSTFTLPKSVFGVFGEDTFTINTPRTPRHWYNYLWNERYVSLISQVGHGEALAQDSMGRRIPVVLARQCLIQDVHNGDAWSPLAQPPHDRMENYSCTHAFGATCIRGALRGIAAEMRFHVPLEELGEIWRITLANTESQPRDVRVFTSVDPGLGGLARPQAHYIITGDYDRDRHMIVLQHPRTPFAESGRSCNVMACSRPVTGYEMRRDVYVGYGDWQRPDAVFRNGGLAGAPPVIERGVLALQVDLTLAPGESQAFHVVVGAGVSPDSCADMVDRLSEPGAMAAGYEKMLQSVHDELDGASLRTEDPLFDRFVSRWLKRQITLGTQWARVRHNGFRDRVQDCGAYAHIQPHLALERLLPVLAKQYASGYAPRTWLDGEIRDNDFADNHVWIPMTVHALLMESGDASWLERRIPFNDGSAASLYEHAHRAVDYLWNDRAQRGLCRFRSGDWNDLMQGVGPRGHGVSVWLSMAWCVANRCLKELAEIVGNHADAEKAAERGRQMADMIETQAWENDRYVCGFDDEGRVVGSATCREGTFFLNMQVWAVLAGLGAEGRAEKAMNEVERRLRCELGTRIVENPYTQDDPRIGDMGLKPVGSGENGGVYLHASAFKLVADCMLKRQDRVAEALQTMPPFRGVRPPCEPYVFCNSYLTTPGHRYGTSGQSWATGTAGWFHTALFNHVLGIKPEWPGLRLAPCLPVGETVFAARRNFRGATYEITYDCTDGNSRVQRLEVDGRTHTDSHLPCRKGQHYRVTVFMAASVSPAEQRSQPS